MSSTSRQPPLADVRDERRRPARGRPPRATPSARAIVGATRSGRASGASGDEGDAVREVGRQRRRDGQGEAGLADAARAGQRQQPGGAAAVAAQQGAGGGELASRPTKEVSGAGAAGVVAASAHSSRGRRLGRLDQRQVRVERRDRWRRRGGRLPAR